MAFLAPSDRVRKEEALGYWRQHRADLVCTGLYSSDKCGRALYGRFRNIGIVSVCKEGERRPMMIRRLFRVERHNSLAFGRHVLHSNDLPLAAPLEPGIRPD